jgi:hypothetical protein
MESDMKGTSTFVNDAGFIGAWAKLAHALAFPGQQLDSAPARAKRSEVRPGILERLDRWFWQQEQREREAYLAKAQDVYDLEERIRRLERSVGSRYY